MRFPQQHTLDRAFHRHEAGKMTEKPSSRRTPNPLIHVPIAPRLVLGFLLPALIAALVAGIIGLQSAQLLSQESSFYQQLFQSYAALTTGNNFLELMDVQVHATLNDALAPHASQEQLTADQKAVQGLATRYDTLLRGYVQHDLLAHHPEQSALFDQAGHPGLAGQQSLLASSALRTWEVYGQAQELVLQDLLDGQVQAAQMLERAQGEPTSADALSALRQLIQFDGRLTSFVQDATTLQERNQLILTLVAVVLVLVAIGVIGRLIYGTLVRRLRQLQRVAQAVQEGDLTSRATVDGRDEITEVAASVNTMLDTIVGLLEETSRQRDALVQAATRLFSDIRLANGGEFEVSAAVNKDPIGMLGNAFQFTVGRFRRFVVRTQKTIEPLEVLAQQELELATTFLATTRTLAHASHMTPPSTPFPSGASGQTTGEVKRSLRQEGEGRTAPVLISPERLRARVQLLSRQHVEHQGETVLHLVEQIAQHAQQMVSATRSRNIAGTHTAEAEGTLEMLLRQLSMEVQTSHQHLRQQLAEMEGMLTQLAISSNMIAGQPQELARLTEGFAQEVTTRAQQLRVLTQELRANLSLFRLDELERRPSFSTPT